MYQDELAENALEQSIGGAFEEDGDAAVEQEYFQEEQGQEEMTDDGEPITTQEPVFDRAAAIERTRAFSARLSEMSGRKVDEFVRKMGLVNEFDRTPVETREQFERYQAMKQAESAGHDPLVSARFSELEQQLSHYRQREADERLQADPQQGEYYRELRGEVLELLDYCRATGRGHVDLEDAYGVILRNHLPRLLGQTKQQSQNQAVRQMRAAAQSSPGALGAGASPRAVDFGSMSDADFERYEQMALRGQLSKN